MKLTIEAVSKKYKGNIWGLKDFDLEIGSGVFGLLGPNGAGKSTLMRILATISKPSSGKIIWNGIDILKFPNKLRNTLGFLPQDFGVYPKLNALEFLKYMAAIKGIDRITANKRINDLMKSLNIFDNRKQALEGFSGGMKQRVGIAQALLNDPKLLIVDEPTAGLDPEERVRFRNLLSELSGDRIVILSSHIVSDIESTANDIGIIKNGKLITHDLPENLLTQFDNKVWETVIPSNEVQGYKDKFLVSSTVRRNDGILIRVVSDNKPSNTSKNVSANLEDVYLKSIASNGTLA